MAELFAVTLPTINEHLKNVFASGELSEQAVIRNFRITAADGKRYQTKHYNLDAVISVGYRLVQDQSYESDFDRSVKHDRQVPDDSLSKLEQVEKLGKGSSGRMP